MVFGQGVSSLTWKVSGFGCSFRLWWIAVEGAEGFSSICDLPGGVGNFFKFSLCQVVLQSPGWMWLQTLLCAFGWML